MDYDGHISRREDERSLKKRLGFKRAAVALARSVLQTHTERSSI
jgi:hypothetical protein